MFFSFFKKCFTFRSKSCFFRPYIPMGQNNRHFLPSAKNQKTFLAIAHFYTYTLFILILCSCAERLSILPPVHNTSILSSLFYSSFLHSAFSSFPSISAHQIIMIYHSIHTQINKYYTLVFSILILLSKKSYI